MSDELVERLAVVICESDTVQPMGWEDVTAHWQDNYRTQARAVLDALTRRIETVAQLDALPDRTVVRSREEVMGDPVERAAEAAWQADREKWETSKPFTWAPGVKYGAHPSITEETRERYRRIADAVIAAYHEAHWIETVEQLRAITPRPDLVAGALIKVNSAPHFGAVFELNDDGTWNNYDDTSEAERRIKAEDVPLPVRLLWTPGDQL